MVLHHAGKCTDHCKIAPGFLGEVPVPGDCDAILYSRKCFGAEL